VKNAVKLLSVSFLAISYCLAIGMASYAPLPPGSPSHALAEKARHLAIISSDTFCHPFHSKSAENKLGDTSASEDTFLASWAAIRAAERLIESEFAHYTLLAQGLLIHYRKADLIFPFHYFW
jgi:hypothetical protein